MAKKKLQKIDGLGPKELQQIRSAIRLVWQRSKARQLIIKQCTDDEGFPFCLKCKKRAPKIFVDHIEPAGEVLSPNYLVRMFCPSSGLQGLCKKCHAPKTRHEAKERAKKRRKIPDFY